MTAESNMRAASAPRQKRPSGDTTLRLSLCVNSQAGSLRHLSPATDAGTVHASTASLFRVYRFDYRSPQVSRVFARTFCFRGLDIVSPYRKEVGGHRPPLHFPKIRAFLMSRFAELLVT